MKYNREDYIIALTVNFLNQLSMKPPLPIYYRNEEKGSASTSKAALVLNNTVMLMEVTEDNGKVEPLINIIFPNKEAVTLNLYEQGEVSVSYDEQESRRFYPRPGVIHTIELLLEMVNQ